MAAAEITKYASDAPVPRRPKASEDKAGGSKETTKSCLSIWVKAKAMEKMENCDLSTMENE